MLLDRPCLLILAVEPPLLVALGPVIVQKSSEGEFPLVVPQISYDCLAFMHKDMLHLELAY